MSLRAYTRKNGGIAVIELDGTIVLGESIGLLRDTIAKALAKGHMGLLLDLEGVSYIDSSGLGELVSCNGLARSRGATLKLVHLQKKIQGLMQITKLITVFETFEDELEAVHSFGAADSANA